MKKNISPERKRRTHAEVVAAREYYAEERHKKLLEKEAKKAEREKLQKERAERKAKREQLRKEKADKVGRGKKLNTKPTLSTGVKYPTYKGDIQIGDNVVASFAGALVSGTVYKIKSMEQDFGYRDGEDMVLYYLRSSDGIKYPVHREKIYKKLN